MLNQPDSLPGLPANNMASFAAVIYKVIHQKYRATPNIKATNSVILLFDYAIESVQNDYILSLCD